MKKIGILTLHTGDNYGALLQCYALRRCINSLNGCCADIIDYDPKMRPLIYENKEVQKKYLWKMEKFRTFNRIYSGVEGKSFTDIDDARAKGFDYYITGSDQVWNTSFHFAKEAYFLNFVPDTAKRIAYAASVGIPVNSPKLKTEWFQRNIPRFDSISLRESSHIEFVQGFTDKEVYSVVDPTLLLSKSDYDDLCGDCAYPEGDYIVLYFLKHDDTAPLVIEFTNMLSRRYGLKVIHSFIDVPDRVFKNESETFYYSDPREFVQLIKHAKAVVTNSFHGTVFALKYHIPFYTYLVERMSSRIVDMLSEVDLSDRIVRGYKPITDNMLEVDFSKSDSVLEKRRQDSLRFLKMALEIIK